MFRDYLKRLTWRHIALFVGGIVLLWVMFGMYMTLALMTLAAVSLALENMPSGAGIAGTMMCVQIIVGGALLAYWWPIRFCMKALDWWEGICGLLPGDS